MSGISLVTKGFISPTNKGGGGSPPVYKDENLPKPLIKVTKFEISGTKKESINEDSFRIKTIKIVDSKDQ